MVIGAAAVAGWTAYDLGMIAWSGDVYLAPTLLPGYALAILIGAIAALGGRDRRLLGVIVLACALAAVVLRGLRPMVPWHLVCLPRALFLLSVAVAIAHELARAGRPASWSAFGLGAVAAAVFSLMYSGTTMPVLTFTLIAGALLALAGAARATRLRYAATAGILLTAIAAAAVMSEQRGQLERPDRPPPARVAADPTLPNLLLIVLDTVSAHHLAPYGYHRVTTPGIDAFVRDHAMRFTQARSVSSWTLPTHASIFTGLYPSQHGADHPRANGDGARAEALGLFPAEPLRDDIPTLAELLSARGYHTGAIVANHGYLNHVFGLDRGFDRYDDRGGVGFKSLLLLQLAGGQQHLRKGSRRAQSITDFGIEWLDGLERDRPFFLFLNYMDAHGPYVAPPPHAYAFDAAQPPDPLEYGRDFFRLQYDRELRYLDEHVTRLLDAVRARGLLDDTVVVITSDHGEGFGTHGFWRHDLALYEEHIAVPLYVKPAGARPAATSDQLVTSPALHYLILQQLGVEAARPAQTASVISEWFQSPALSASARIKADADQSFDRDLLVWSEDGLKWIASSLGDVKAYDLRVDPFERVPLPLTAEQIARARARAAAWWKDNPPLARDEGQAPALDPTVIDRLRNLGYVH